MGTFVSCGLADIEKHPHNRDFLVRGIGISDSPPFEPSPIRLRHRFLRVHQPLPENRLPRLWPRPYQNRSRIQSRNDLRSAEERIRQVAKSDKEVRFTSIWHHVTNTDRLGEAYFSLEPKAAAGVDGVTWQTYGENLEGNLEDLSGRLKRGAYKARPVQRVFIPKGDGREKPIGIPTLEDKIVQRATAEVLNAVYEVDFLGFSYGFRPGRNQHNALDAITVGIERNKVDWVLGVDVSGFFDAMSHEWIMKFIRNRWPSGTGGSRIPEPLVSYAAGPFLRDAMRLFHLVTYAEETNRFTAESYEICGFDHTALWDGVPLPNGLPPDARLLVSGQQPIDYLPNPLSWPICSTRLTEIRLQRANADIQALDAPLFHHKTGRPISGYHVLNVTRRLRCIDPDRSDATWDEDEPDEIESVSDWVFRSKSIPDDVHIFRADEYVFDLIVSDQGAQDLVGKEMTGIAFIRTNSV